MKNKLLIIVFIFTSIITFGQWNDVTNYTPANTGSNPLGGNSVEAMQLDGNGYIWILSYSSYEFTRFNGTDWLALGNESDTLVTECFAADNQGNILLLNINEVYKYNITTDYLSLFIPNLPVTSSVPTLMFVDSGNNVWISTYEGFIKINNQDTIIYTTADGLSYNWIRCIIETNNGEIWCGTMYGIDVWDGINWTHIDVGSQFGFDPGIRSLYQSQSGDIWAGGQSIYKFDGNNWENFHYTNCPYFYFPYGGSNETTTNIISDANGILYFGLMQSGILSYDGNSWEWFNENNYLLSNRPRCCSRDLQGNVWFGFASGGLLKISETQQYQYYTTSDGLAEPSTQSILEDSQNRIWFSTSNGISCLENQTWTSYLQNYNFRSCFGTFYNSTFINCTKIREHENGNIGSINGSKLNIWNDTTWNTISSWAIGDPHDFLWEGEDTIYIGHSNGFSRAIGPDYNLGSAWNHYSGLPDNLVNTLVKGPNNQIWIGTHNGLATFDGNSIQTILIPSEDIGNQINFLLFDEENKLWVATNHGVGIFDGINWNFITTPFDEVSGFVTCIEETMDSAMWFGTDSGACRLKNNNWAYFTMQDGLIDYRIFTIEEDHNKNMWFGTFKGVSKMNNDTLQQIIAHKAVNKPLTIFPNPATNQIQISSKELINTIEIYNMAGCLVQKMQCNSKQQIINVSNLQAGSYFVRTSGKNGVWVKKVVVISF